MTYLEILDWARMGIAAEIAKNQEMKKVAIQGQALNIALSFQKAIDDLKAKTATLDAIEALHNRK